MILAKKIRLCPTKEQEVLFFKSAGTARWAYNYFLSEQQKVYEEYLKNDKHGKSYVTEGDIRKHINNVLKKTTHTWLKEIGSNIMKQAIKDADGAYKRYFKGISKEPKFKEKHKETPSFYVNYESLVKKQGGFHGEKIGFVKTVEELPDLINGVKQYSNPRITFDGKYWYLSVGYEIKEEKETLTEESLGIDLGVKKLAVCSNGKKRVPVWIRPLRECKNIQKQNQVIRHIHKKLKNIRNNYLHQTTSEIVKTKPSQIVMETLNVTGMMKNKHLSKAIAQQKLYEFKRQIQYKCQMRGIVFMEADKWYPSSKKCSCCGNIKKNLKLSDRIYKCDKCGLIMDKDLNASINLASYKLV